MSSNSFFSTILADLDDIDIMVEDELDDDVLVTIARTTADGHRHEDRMTEAQLDWLGRKIAEFVRWRTGLKQIRGEGDSDVL